MEKDAWKSFMESSLSEIVQLLYAGSLSPFCVMLICKIIDAIFHSLTCFLSPAGNEQVCGFLKPLMVIPFQRLRAAGELSFSG